MVRIQEAGQRVWARARPRRRETRDESGYDDACVGRSSRSFRDAKPKPTTTCLCPVQWFPIGRRKLCTESFSQWRANLREFSIPTLTETLITQTSLKTQHVLHTGIWHGLGGQLRNLWWGQFSKLSSPWTPRLCIL